MESKNQNKIQIQTQKATQGFILSLFLSCVTLVAILSLLSGNTVYAALDWHYGMVTARGLEKGPNGEPVFAEIGSDGQPIAEIGEAIGELADAKVMSADRYRAIVAAFNTFVTQNQNGIAQGARVMTRDAYENAVDFDTVEVPLADIQQGSPVTTESVSVLPGRLAANTLSVYVRSNETIIDPRLLPVETGNILFQAPIDLSTSSIRELDGAIRSVLLNKHGQVIRVSQHTIGYKSNFFDPNSYGFSNRVAYGPIVGAKVEGVSRTKIPGYVNEEGKYGLAIVMVPCFPGISSADMYIVANIKYRDYNPEAKEPIGEYTFGTLGDSQCFAWGDFSSSPLFPGGADNILVDLVMPTGKGGIANPDRSHIAFGTTEYTYTPPYLTKLAPHYLDVNRDRQTDLAVLNADGSIVGVHLDGTTTDEAGQPKAPDLTRLADTVPDFKHQGLLKGISLEDWKETDIYVYRVSTGQLVAKKPYLLEREIIASENGFYYRMWLPGPLWGTFYGIGNGGGLSGTEAFQRRLNYPEEMIGLRANFLRPGEEIQLIAVNRPTGYIGTVTATLEAPDDGMLDFPIDKLELRPPNLKVKVERIYQVEAGLTQGEDREYQLGFEGSATTKDTMISIHTQWLDEDGTPLPETLEGYTGRLAKVTGPNSLSGGEVSRFAIEPGTHRQVLKFKGDIIGTEHFYVHVSGYPEWQNLGVGAGTGPLQYRPAKYVPIKVPLYDEEATTRLRNLNAYNQQDGNPYQETVPAQYQWFYRPEMQFSVFDLTVQGINRTDIDGNVVDIYNNSDIPVIASSDQSIELLYDLLMSDYNPLDPIGGERELIWAVGESEQLDTGTGSLTFTELAHLAELDPEDFLSIRLYSNNDSENVLWEYAFEFLTIDSRIAGYDNQTDNVWYVTADNPTVPLQSVLVGFADRDPNLKEPITVHWDVDGAGYTSPPAKTDADLGVFDTELIMPTTAGATGIVSASIDGTNSKAIFKQVTVLAGEPAVINIATSGEAIAQEVGTLTATIIVRDQYGNLVEDGTPVLIGAGNGVLITSYEDSTTGGQATVNITGDAFPVTGAQFTVKSGNIEVAHTFDVLPLNVAFVTPATTVERNTVQPIQVQVTTPSGAAVANTLVTLSSSMGQFQEVQLDTDVNGMATAQFFSGSYIGNSTLQVRAVTRVVRAIPSPLMIQQPRLKLIHAM